MGSPTGWPAMFIKDAIRHHNACPLVLFWLQGVALDLILDAPDLVLEALDIILDALDYILKVLDPRDVCSVSSLHVTRTIWQLHAPSFTKTI